MSAGRQMIYQMRMRQGWMEERSLDGRTSRSLQHLLKRAFLDHPHPCQPLLVSRDPRCSWCRHPLGRVLRGAGEGGDQTELQFLGVGALQETQVSLLSEVRKVQTVPALGALVAQRAFL